jgi:DNA invertase Pin-like site-specific DNA recombinase
MNVVKVLDFDTFEKSFQKKNVCAYARVSSLKDEQATSIDTQVEIYTNMIQDNPEWNFVGVFQDHGKSGTSTDKRTQFNMMVQIAKAGGIDLIVTKSISRFARNTVDCLSTIQELRKFGTEVWFEEDNLSSMDPKIEFVITVIAGMAQEESRNISDNVRWGVKKRFSEGIIPMVTSKILGYSRNEQGDIIVVEKEATIVRKIFDLYTNGMSQRKIAEHLNELGYKTKFKGVAYHKTGISGILNNEKYTGNSLLQKTTYKDVGTRKKINYQDVLPRYYIENSHPAIIKQEQFELAQSIKDKKIMKYNKTLDKKKLMDVAKRKTKYFKQVQCANCGKYYIHKINNKGKPWERHHLICASNENKKTCKNESIFTEVYDDVLKSVINAICIDKKGFLDSLYSKLTTHSELLLLHQDIKATQERLSQINALLTQLIDKEDDFTYDIREKLEIEKKKLTTFKVELNNKLYTTHNIEVTFNNYKKMIKNLGNDEKNDIELFSRILIHNRNKIDFVLDPFDTNSKKVGKILLNTKTDYVIRKTTFTNKARLVLK